MGCSASTPGSEGRKRSDPLQTPRFASGFFDHYNLDLKLGHGSHAQVWQVSRLASSSDSSDDSVKEKQKCAKLIDLRDVNSKYVPELERRAEMEATIALKVGRHPNVVKLYGAFKQIDMVILVMEMCNCSLEKYRKETSNISEKSLGALVFQMLNSLQHLHSRRVVHRDVKPDNFLLGGSNGRTVKLCDFGLAAILPDDGMLYDCVGTTPFMCPEMCAELPGSTLQRLTHGRSWYNESADVWSLAVTVYLFVFGALPYASKDGSREGTLKAIAAGVGPTFELANKTKAQPSPALDNFVRALLQRDVDQRPSVETALSLPYMVRFLPSDNSHMRKQNSDFSSSISGQAYQFESTTSDNSGGEKRKNELCVDIGLDAIRLAGMSERSREQISTPSGTPLNSPRTPKSPHKFGVFSPSSSSSLSPRELAVKAPL